MYKNYHVYAKYRDQKKLSVNDFINDQKAVNWNSLKSLSEIDSMWSSFRLMKATGLDDIFVKLLKLSNHIETLVKLHYITSLKNG